MDFLEILKKWNGGISRGAQARLAKELNVSKVSVLRWGRGDIPPSEVQINKMSKLLKIKPEVLNKIFNISHKAYQVVPRIGLQRVPILGVSSATKEKFILEDIEGYLNIPKSSPNQFAIRVEGDCMVDPNDVDNSIYHGNYVIVDPDIQAVNGDIVIARIDTEFSTIKRMFIKGEIIKLIPDNPKYQAIEKPLKDIIIIGKVVNIHKLAKRKKERI